MEEDFDSDEAPKFIRIIVGSPNPALKNQSRLIRASILGRLLPRSRDPYCLLDLWDNVITNKGRTQSNPDFLYEENF